MADPLIKLPFRHSKGRDIGIEVLTFADLYQRQAHLNHEITAPHSIGFYMLLYIEDGQGTHTVDFQTFDVAPHTLAVISKHQIQQFDPALALGGYIILITEDFIHRALFDLAGSVSRLLFEPVTTQAYFLRDAQVMLPHIERLTAEYTDGVESPEQAPIMLRELGLILLKTERLRRAQLTSSMQQAEASPRLVAFRDLLQQHFAAHWTAQMYADALGFSKKTLGNLTRKHLHRSPKAVIDQRLLLEIKRMLVHTDLSIKEIAYALGFEDPSNLNKFFKRVDGSTPSAFRKKGASCIAGER